MNLNRRTETFNVRMVFALFGYRHQCCFMTGVVFYIFLMALSVLKRKTKNLILQKIIGSPCGCNSNNILDLLI